MRIKDFVKVCKCVRVGRNVTYAESKICKTILYLSSRGCLLSWLIKNRKRPYVIFFLDDTSNERIHDIYYRGDLYVHFKRKRLSLFMLCLSYTYLKVKTVTSGFETKILSNFFPK